ncbi:uncharacterized protein BDR25DRAFT_315908 [Lindgomyces ingoldianus]|uniref:Uncharacterized protein n=1 Tax=Lindgomyces ingoldianus TaxID=673940 RepID=A0ACB6QR33_9PLEO|nr:uncharacterized protein BDR25DRAFT_315908 [Lindgomyces ingoldianus]KAF2468985.1 hypothetical protein BDR25DRAFT_315908 [Lindgomyces ingoldianus]
MASSQPRRYLGDGFDYRRPISLSRNDAQTPLIDLTADDAGPSMSSNAQTAARAQRPPRFPREIIDLDDDASAQPVAPPDSPDIQFISARTLDPPRRPVPPTLRTNTPNNDGDDDDLEILGVHSVPAERQAAGEYFDQMVDHFLENMVQGPGLTRFQAEVQRIRRPAIPPRAGGARGRPHVHVGFMAPEIDFHVVGFDMGLGGGPAPPPPTYDAPPAAPNGFTRSPVEGDVLVCPNCEDELCLGDSDLKKQVWIIKKCGHVYCGDCTANRALKTRPKGKEKIGLLRPKTFKICVVEGCEEKAHTRNSMIQVFL